MVVALTVGMAFGLPNFKLDASADSLTLEHDDDLNFFREVIQRYGSDNFLIVTFSPKQGDLFDDENLQLLASLRDELATIKIARRGRRRTVFWYKSNRAEDIRECSLGLAMQCRVLCDVGDEYHSAHGTICRALARYCTD